MGRDGNDGRPSRSPVFTTHDRDEARQCVTDIYIPHDLQTRGGHALDFKLRHLASERLTIGHLVYGADAELIVPPMVDCYHVNLTLHGQTMVAQKGTRASTRAGQSGALFSPTHPFTVRWSPEAVQYAIKIPRPSLESHVSKLVNRRVQDPVSFALGFDLASGPGQSLLSSVHFLRNELARPGGISTMPLARDQLESLVLTQILTTVPNTYSDLLNAPDRPARRSKIRAAIELIEERPDEGLSLADLAESVGCTARALQRGFKELVGMSPTAYARAVRLERVHQDLTAEADCSTVTDVAMRWGFFHLGRFAQQYKDRFGVLPSETVRRARLYGS